MTDFDVALDGDLPWADFDIPGGSTPVRMALLRKEDDTRARTLMVSFPDGWHRSGPGYYEAGEEVVILSGALELCGATLYPGDWAVIPRKTIRTDMRARGEVLAFARFDGPARYVDGVEGAGAQPFRTLADIAASPRELQRTDSVRSWVGPPPGEPLPFDVELFEVAPRRWSFIRAGVALPAVGGPCFWRTTDPRGLA